MIKTLFLVVSLLFCSSVFSQNDNSVFALCDSSSVWPYYNPPLQYQGGFWEIKNHFLKNYPTEEFKKLTNNSGIITIQFQVNCQGEAGDFKILQCDLNYKRTQLNEKITGHFVTQTKELKNWIPPVDEKGNGVNSHKFFSFRLVAGKLIEILPK